MGLLSIFKRRSDTPSGHSAPVDASDAVQRARTRARQRLIGAVVLVGVGIIGFPLVFETQPRPIPVDIPIEAPPREGAPALVMPVGRAPTAAIAASTASMPATAAPPMAAAPNDVITESREEAGREVASPPASSAAAAPARPASKPAPVPVAATSTPPEKPAVEHAPTSDGARAQALLEGKAAKPAESAGRFVVQVGAFADASAAHETRLKVEKLGLKTYTQVATTSAGNRIRVRVGPFGSRDEADKALAKARGAGLTAVVLTL